MGSSASDGDLLDDGGIDAGADDRLCPKCGATGSDVAKHGFVLRADGTRGSQRFKCKRCGASFVETAGTLGYRRRSDVRNMLYAAYLVEGEGLNIFRAAGELGVRWETLNSWLKSVRQEPLLLRRAVEFYEARELLREYIYESQPRLRMLSEYRTDAGGKLLRSQVFRRGAEFEFAHSLLERASRPKGGLEEKEMRPFVDGLRPFLSAYRRAHMRLFGSDPAVEGSIEDQ